MVHHFRPAGCSAVPYDQRGQHGEPHLANITVRPASRTRFVKGSSNSTIHQWGLGTSWASGRKMPGRGDMADHLQAADTGGLMELAKRISVGSSP